MFICVILMHMAASVQLLSEYPSAAPGSVCYRCGSDRKPVIDTGVSIDMEGGLYLCHACVEEMASLLGMIQGEKAEELRQSNRALGQRNKALRETNDALREAFNKQEELEAL